MHKLWLSIVLNSNNELGFNIVLTDGGICPRSKTGESYHHPGHVTYWPIAADNVPLAFKKYINQYAKRAIRKSVELNKRTRADQRLAGDDYNSWDYKLINSSNNAFDNMDDIVNRALRKFELDGSW